jgi:hypothetical protein
LSVFSTVDPSSDTRYPDRVVKVDGSDIHLSGVAVVLPRPALMSLDQQLRLENVGDRKAEHRARSQLSKRERYFAEKEARIHDSLIVAGLRPARYQDFADPVIGRWDLVAQRPNRS